MDVYVSMLHYDSFCENFKKTCLQMSWEVANDLDSVHQIDFVFLVLDYREYQYPKHQEDALGQTVVAWSQHHP